MCSAASGLRARSRRNWDVCSKVNGRLLRVDEAFGPNAIKDDLLRMMFSCCHTHLAQEGQVALMVHILCGFSVDEIASALVTTHAVIEERITRSKKTLAKSKRLFDVTVPTEFLPRLPAVHTALYLLLARATTEQIPNSQFATNFAVKPCASPPFFLSIPSVPLRRHMPCRTDVFERRASSGANRCFRGPEVAVRPGSLRLGSAAH